MGEVTRCLFEEVRRGPLQTYRRSSVPLSGNPTASRRAALDERARII